MLDSFFQFLFKYRPVVFQRGELVLRAPGAGVLLLLLLLVLAAAWSYRRMPASARPLDRLVLVVARLAVLAVLALALLRPTLAVSSQLPQQNFLAVLLDDSRSMRIPDEDGKPRSAVVAREFGSATSPLRHALARRFQLRYFRFGASASRLDEPAALRFEETGTAVAGSLRRVRDELEGVPLAGVVVVTDGADNSAESPSAALLSLKAAGVPVYAVGVGRAQLDPDVELARVQTPPEVLRGASVAVDLVLSQRGFAGRSVPVQIEDDGRILARQDVVLPPDGQPAPVTVRFTASEPGLRRVRFRVPPQAGEVLTRNNEQTARIRVQDERAKILYIEGEPRFEVKFIRRAAATDSSLQLVVLQRTAKDKFLRLDVTRGDELVDGFPRTREELFGYSGLVLGSIEASFFTYDQLRMIADFVGTRGGGLLALGGRHAFAEGGYGETPVADALPVVLPDGGGTPGFFAPMSVAPARAGRGEAVTLLSDTPSLSPDRWATLPPVSTVNALSAVKPGATTLLVGTGDALPSPQVVLASQRYGRGSALAFTPEDSWLWSMHASAPTGDDRHDRFWRQLLRRVVDGVPSPVVASVTPDRAEAGSPVTIRADVADSAFLAVNDARVSATVRGPDGTDTEVPLEWTVDRDGGYRGRFVPSSDGPYAVTVEARRGRAVLGRDVAGLDVAPGDAEYFDAGMREPLLRRVAEETGGRFYTAGTAASLPDDIRYTGGGVTSVEELDLWDMPALFFLLVGLLSAEWGWRRARGLA